MQKKVAENPKNSKVPNMLTYPLGDAMCLINSKNPDTVMTHQA